MTDNAHEDRVAPRTAAGRELLAAWWRMGQNDDWRGRILAIETEAAKQGAAQGFGAGYDHAKAFYEAASLDSDELRKLRAIEKAARDLNMTMPDLGDGDPMSDLDDALADYDEWLDAQDRALLSAGDKKDELGG